MNERIKELFGKALDQAVPETWTTLSHEQMTKLSEVFAQLIVRECADFVAAAQAPVQSDGERHLWAQAVRHQVIQAAPQRSYNDGLEAAAKACDELEDYLWNYGSPGARTAVQDVSARIRALKEKP